MTCIRDCDVVDSTSYLYPSVFPPTPCFRHAMSPYTMDSIRHVLQYCDLRCLAAFSETNRALRDYCLTRLYSCISLSSPEATTAWFRRLTTIPGRASLVEEIVIADGGFCAPADLHIDPFGHPRASMVDADLVQRVRYIVGCTDNLISLHVAHSELLLSSDAAMARSIAGARSIEAIVLTGAGPRCAAMISRTPDLCTALVHFGYPGNAGYPIDLSHNTILASSSYTLQWLAFTGDVSFPGHELRINGVFRSLTRLDLNTTSVNAGMIIELYPHLLRLSLGAHTTIVNAVTWNVLGPQLISLQCPVSALLELPGIQANEMRLLNFSLVLDNQRDAVVRRIRDGGVARLVLDSWDATISPSILQTLAIHIKELAITFLNDDEDVANALVSRSYRFYLGLH